MSKLLPPNPHTVEGKPLFIAPNGPRPEKLGDQAHLVPGYHGTAEVDLETASKIGYPLMIKASSGGGGRGMRIVREPSQLASEIARARSEALRNFNSDELLFERYIEGGKHIEVEHPVTEMCSGLDLVSLGIYVGGDGDLSKLAPVANLTPFGHSIECRVCAEEPGADFTPRTGVVRMLEVLCLGQPGVRFDTSIRVGTTVFIFFDAMLGKLIVHAATRPAAIEKMLQEWDVMVEYDGSNGDYNLKIWTNHSSQAVQKAENRIKEKYGGSKSKSKALAAELKASRATAKFYGSLPTRDGLEGRARGDWQLGVQQSEVHQVRSTLLTSSQVQLSSLPATTGAHLATGRARWATATLSLEIDGITSTHVLATDHSFQDHETSAQTAWVWSYRLCGPIKVVRHGMRTYALANQSSDDSAASKAAYVTPMPAKILKILVEDNADVEAGQALLICESMKIETTIRAQVAGRLHLHVQDGDTVPEGKLLCQVFSHVIQLLSVVLCNERQQQATATSDSIETDSAVS
ncbi:hypothetical protein L1887_52169 [Cichorium endivia]|nr:hypothetical protein L1887_52169 [Cichorium endivia]